MNVLASIKSLISRFTRAATPNPAPSPPPVAPPPPPPEPSCFVKGLIHSMRTEPQDWKRECFIGLGFSWSHKTQGVTLYEDSRPYGGLSDRLPEHESKLLATALQEYLVLPEKERANREVQQREAAKREYFEKLGCPEKTP